MFGWLKRWWEQSAQAREDQELEQALARTVGMARAIEAQRAQTKLAQETAAKVRAARDAAWTESWQRARQSENARVAQAQATVREMQLQRRAHQGRPPLAAVPPKPAAKPAASSSNSCSAPSAPGMGLDDGVPLLWSASVPAAPHVTGHGGSFDGGGASGDWSSSSSPSDSGSSGSSGDSGGGSSGGGGD